MPVVPLPTVYTALGFPAHLHSEAMEASHSLAEMYLQSQELKGDLFCRAFFCLVCDFISDHVQNVPSELLAFC